MLQITNDEALRTQTTEDKRNEDAAASDSSGASGGIGESIKNLSTAANLAKSKKAKLTKLKKLDLPNTKANFGTDFLTPGAKKAFIHLQKAFIKAPIFKHFDPKHDIEIGTDALEYNIDEFLRLMTPDQYSSGHVSYKGSNSEIGQWHLIVFFSQKMILTETCYKTHNQKFLAIIKAFKI